MHDSTLLFPAEASRVGGATWEDAFRMARERRLPDSHEYSQHLRGGPSQTQQLPALKATIDVPESEAMGASSRKRVSEKSHDGVGHEGAGGGNE
ncbi:hypothetical protein [Paraburkholderia hospita]|uniref:hypothetical protein n=1 Tax=Paraburkholderia hospita TaxID=169430 RepID=UPI00103A58E8|nr:hypothetical protein [Paraburkholderia hospita]